MFAFCVVFYFFCTKHIICHELCNSFCNFSSLSILNILRNVWPIKRVLIYRPSIFKETFHYMSVNHGSKYTLPSFLSTSVTISKNINIKPVVLLVQVGVNVYGLDANADTCADTFSLPHTSMQSVRCFERMSNETFSQKYG